MSWPRDVKIAVIVASLLVLVPVVAGASFLIYVFATSGLEGLTGPLDEKFGDQHLKTAVALVELHKVRYGQYPAKLSEIRFAGEWDQIHLGAVDYCSTADRAAYFVEVRRGYLAKPSLQLAQEFWQGTGYRAALGPCK